MPTPERSFPPPTSQKSNGPPLTVSVLAQISKIILSLKEIYNNICNILPLISQYFFSVTKLKPYFETVFFRDINYSELQWCHASRSRRSQA